MAKFGSNGHVQEVDVTGKYIKVVASSGGTGGGTGGGAGGNGGFVAVHGYIEVPNAGFLTYDINAISVNDSWNNFSYDNSKHIVFFGSTQMPIIDAATEQALWAKGFRLGGAGTNYIGMTSDGTICVSWTKPLQEVFQ